MILKGFNRKKDDKDFGQTLTPNYDAPTKIRKGPPNSEIFAEPEVIAGGTELPIINNLRPVVLSSGEPIELPPYVIFVRGTPEAWARLEVKNKDTLYFISAVGSNVGDLYLGDILIASGASWEVDAFISSTSTNPVQNRVIYNALQEKADIDNFVPITNAEIDEICV